MEKNKEKLLSFMKMSLIQAVFSCVFASVSLANNVMAQEILNRSLSIETRDEKLKTVLTTIEKSTNVKFSYSPQVIKSNRKVSFSARNTTLGVVLNKLLSPLHVQYSVAGNNIILKRADTDFEGLQEPQVPIIESKSPIKEVLKPAFIVSGSITDEKKEPLVGASIAVEGTTKGTLSDENGKYSLELTDDEKNAKLIFSFVGYETQVVSIYGQSSISISLKSGNALNEVVVVGYGDQKRRNVTGAVGSIDSKALKDLPLTSADQKLAGQIAGVQVSQVTGAPGGGVVIRVRGSGSIGAGDDPLYVIDGFPVTNGYSRYSNPLAALNTDDIESITVLKDASSTAIYGSRGANGVILIKTKSAKAGVSSLDVNYYTGTQRIPDRSKIQMMTAQEWAQFRVEARQDLAKFQNKTFDPTTVPTEYQNPASLGAGTNWFETMTRTAPIQDLNITVTKGTENLRSVISAGYFNQQGTVKNSDFERFSFRANIEGNPHKLVTVGVNLNPSFVNRKIADSEGHFNSALVTASYLNSPLSPVYLADGSYNNNITSPDMFANANPLSILLDTKNRQSTARTLGNTYVIVKLAEGLNFKSSFNIDWSTTKTDFFKPSYVGAFRSLPPIPANGSTANSTLLNWLNENTLTYDKTFGKHNLNALLGYTIQQEKYNNTVVNGSGYPDDVVQTINAATIVTSGADVQMWRLLSYLGRVSYAYDDKYLLSVAVRRDGSSRFGPNNRWAMFPSVSGGWRVSDEAFFPKTTWLEELKLRASYGLSGNNAIGNYTYLPGVTVDNYTFGGALSSGFRLNSLANNNLGWESSRQMDIGFDASLFKGRVYFSTEYYKRYTEDMLQSIDIPAASGFSSAITNIGKVENKGWEFTVNTHNTTGKLKWDTDFNISFNRNKVLDLGNKTQIISGDVSSNITVVGKPMGMFYGYDFLGIFQSQSELDNSPKQAGQVVGSVKYRDANGDGKIDANDKTFIGSPYPKFIWGLTNRISYKGFDLSILINGMQGLKVFDVYKRFTTNIDGVFNVEAEVKDRWRSPENPGNGRIPTTVANTALSRELNSLWVNDASYLAVRNITLGYTLNNKLAKSIRLYVSAQNALLFTKYKNGWPEINYQGNNSLAPGINYNGYPVPITYNVGANVKF